MLKSTHKPSVETSITQPPLPEGWTEHNAPTGHSYFYNSLTQNSTYTRPSTQHNGSADLVQAPGTGFTPYEQPDTGPSPAHRQFHSSYSQDRSHGRRNHNTSHRNREDRPKTQHAIPDCEPWVLVKTRFGRRFVYNPEKGESFWKFPPEVMKAVIEYDRTERERKAEKTNSSALEDVATEPRAANSSNIDGAAASTTLDDNKKERPIGQPLVDSDGEEYEEVEVTDDEDEEEQVSKRLKGNGMDDQGDNPIDFDEDDIAYQLAAMGEDYGLDPGEYGEDHDGLEEGAEGLPLTAEDSSALFRDMLDDHHISPYTTWDRLIEAGQMVDDDRYTVLPNMRSRKEVWSDWSRDKIQELKDRRANEEKKDPRIAYFALLEAKGTPKLYWPEFRRKYQKEPEMRSSKISDKDRERWYREYINRLKTSEGALKADLVSLLKSLPLAVLNRSTSVDSLPSALLTDLRYVSLRRSIRDPMVETHLSSLAEAPDDIEVSPEEAAAKMKEREDRSKREQALADRQQRVEDEKRKQRGALLHSKERLRDEEEDVRRAMHVSKEGLRGHMQTTDDKDLKN